MNALNTPSPTAVTKPTTRPPFGVPREHNEVAAVQDAQVLRGRGRCRPADEEADEVSLPDTLERRRVCDHLPTVPLLPPDFPP